MTVSFPVNLRDTVKFWEISKYCDLWSKHAFFTKQLKHMFYSLNCSSFSLQVNTENRSELSVMRYMFSDFSYVSLNDTWQILVHLFTQQEGHDGTESLTHLKVNGYTFRGSSSGGFIFDSLLNWGQLMKRSFL